MKKLKRISILGIILLLLINQNVFANISDGWNFIVKAKDSYLVTDTLDNIKLAETCDEQTLINGTIAPGTCGNFSIIIETDELGAEYNIIFDNFSADFPENLKFYVDSEEYDINTGFYNKLDYKGIATHTVNWIWEYEGDDEYVERESSEISFRISVKALQVNERIIAEQIIRDVLPKTGF